MIIGDMTKSLESARHATALKLHRGATFGEVSNAPCLPGKPANRAVSGCGMALAISNCNLGVAADLSHKTGRGGARNHADRESYHLTATQIANLTAAERHATAIGLPFTRMISIHWEAAGVPLQGMSKATGRFIDLMCKALARHGSGTAWLWVHEGGEGKGGHCHLLIHVPAYLVARVTGLQRSWLRRISGNPYRARVIKSRPIGGRLGLEVGNPDLHAINLQAALAYVFKGASYDAASQFDLTRLEPGGLVIGKRCGTSQNLGAKARKTKE